MATLEPIKAIANILQAELGLAPWNPPEARVTTEVNGFQPPLAADQVLVNNQKFDIPPDDRLYLTLTLLGSKTFATKTAYENDPVKGVLQEVQATNRQEMISLHLMSRSNEARTRNWEVSPALKSTLAQQVSEEQSFQIGYLPTSMNDVSQLEGTARLNEFVLTFNVLVAYRKSKPVEYFDEFPTPVLITNS